MRGDDVTYMHHTLIMLQISSTARTRLSLSLCVFGTRTSLTHAHVNLIQELGAASCGKSVMCRAGYRVGKCRGGRHTVGRERRDPRAGRHVF